MNPLRDPSQPIPAHIRTAMERKPALRTPAWDVSKLSPELRERILRDHVAPVPAKESAPDCAPVAMPVDHVQPENAFDGPEKLLQRDFKTDMERRGVHVVAARCDQASTIESGLPDFHCLYTDDAGICRACAVEFKRSGGAVKKRQREVIAEMRRKRIPVLVAWNLADAINFAKLNLQLP